MKRASMNYTKSFQLSINQYHLKLKLRDDLVLPLCKGKYFRFQIRLEAPQGLEIPKSEKFPIEAKLFTSVKPFKQLTQSLSGGDILKGATKAELTYDETESQHIANFKLQINEISSHFSGFNLLIEPCNNEFLEKLGLYIKPLLLKQINVMSKEKVCQKLRTKTILFQLINKA